MIFDSKMLIISSNIAKIPPMKVEKHLQRGTKSKVICSIVEFSDQHCIFRRAFAQYVFYEMNEICIRCSTHKITRNKSCVHR